MNDDFYFKESIRRAYERATKRIEKESLFGEMTASTNQPAPLTYDNILDALYKLDVPKCPQFKMVSSRWAVEIDAEHPTREETRPRTLKERFFSLPWRPWKKTKTVTVANYKPCMYRAGDVIIYHPSLEQRIKEQFK